MSGFAGFLPDPSGDSTWLFRAVNSVSGGAPTGPATWSKPRNARLVFILAQGPGGGGGLGQATATGTGGGGASAGTTVAWCGPALLLPDLLYIAPGTGGVGATPGSPVASAGIDTIVGFSPQMVTTSNSAAQFIRANGGTVGSSGASGGAAGGASSTQAAAITLFGTVTVTAGQGGAAGGATTGASVTFPTTANAFATGGAGGAGCSGSTDNAGGNITVPSAGWEPLVASLTGGAAGGSRGQDGLFRVRQSFAPFYSTGGSGGGSLHTAGTGGAGGNGGPGAGGAGGGAGATTGGSGGNGGDGFVLIAVV